MISRWAIARHCNKNICSQTTLVLVFTALSFTGTRRLAALGVINISRLRRHKWPRFARPKNKEGDRHGTLATVPSGAPEEQVPGASDLAIPVSSKNTSKDRGITHPPNPHALHSVRHRAPNRHQGKAGALIWPIRIGSGFSLAGWPPPAARTAAEYRGGVTLAGSLVPCGTSFRNRKRAALRLKSPKGKVNLLRKWATAARNGPKTPLLRLAPPIFLSLAFYPERCGSA